MAELTVSAVEMMRTGGASEDLGDVEGLRQEALDLTGARHRHLVLLTQLVHAQDGNDILQVLVVLQQKPMTSSLSKLGLGIHRLGPMKLCSMLDSQMQWIGSIDLLSQQASF